MRQASWMSLGMMVTPGMDGAQIGVLEQTNEVGLDLSDQTLEGHLVDQQLSECLVVTDLSQSYGTRPGFPLVAGMHLQAAGIACCFLWALPLVCFLVFVII